MNQEEPLAIIPSPPTLQCKFIHYTPILHVPCFATASTKRREQK